MVRKRRLLAILVGAGAALPTTVSGVAAIGSPTGVRPTQIVKAAGNINRAVARYRALLGPNNGGAPGGYATGRREINWDGVPDELARPNALPADFFNGREDPRARGAVLLTPGSGVAVSADAENSAGAAPRFGDIRRRRGAAPSSSRLAA